MTTDLDDAINSFMKPLEEAARKREEKPSVKMIAQREARARANTYVARRKEAHRVYSAESKRLKAIYEQQREDAIQAFYNNLGTATEEAYAVYIATLAAIEEEEKQTVFNQ